MLFRSAVTRSDFEHCDVAFFLGKNPWHSHSIPRARVTLREIAKDPARTLIVVDPRRTETAELADIHLQVRPGTDAWLLRALVTVLIQEDLLDRAFLARCDGLEATLAAFATPVADDCAVCGVPEALVREAARKIGGAKAFASFEDLGVQMNRNSTLVSWLHHLLWLLTGQFGRPGTRYTALPLIPWIYGDTGKKSPVVGAPIIAGLVPCNRIADEILTDHPARYRAMTIEAANPAHSLADSPRFREAMAALEVSVVIDVAMSESARLADYVLPASTQLEKAEASFFNFEFPDTAFHLRPALLPPPPGPLPEAEIHARLCEALGVIDADLVARLTAAARDGLAAFGAIFLPEVAFHPARKGQSAVYLYRSLGAVLPEDRREAAVLLGLCLQRAVRSPDDLARAGFEGPPPVAATALFQAILESPSGLVFSRGRWEDVASQLPGGRFQLALPEMIEELRGLTPPTPDPAFPFVLSAGERRSMTANTILRDPRWRTKDAGGALRVSPSDAERLGLQTGSRARIETAGGTAEAIIEVDAGMSPGHAAIPNGLGLTRGDGAVGVAPNELTRVEDRDAYAGTPWHKYVPARIVAV